MPDRIVDHHISSAVVSARPERIEQVMREIALLPDTEISAFAGSKIVVVLEGASSAVVADRLTQIALIEGVVTANMVFEHVETVRNAGA